MPKKAKKIDEGKVRVQVGFRMVSTYFNEVEMTREEFDAWNEKMDDAASIRDKDRVSQDIFTHLGFDYSDATDYEEPELETFCLSE